MCVSVFEKHRIWQREERTLQMGSNNTHCQPVICGSLKQGALILMQMDRLCEQM